MKKLFLLLFFTIFVSNSAKAEALSVTWKASHIPDGSNTGGVGPTNCRATTNNALLDKDSAQDPYDLAFSEDGLQIFIANRASGGDISDNPLRMNRLGSPFNILSDKMGFDPSATCDDVDGANPNDVSGGALSSDHVEGIHIANGGSIFFTLTTGGVIGKFNLTTPYDISTMTYERKFDTGTVQIDSMHFSRDGSKMFTLNSTSANPIVTTYTLSEPFDISSPTEIHSVDLDTKGIDVSTPNHNQGFDIEFTPDGSAMFILMMNKNVVDNADIPTSKNFIYQFSLSTNDDVSTATNLGSFHIDDVFLNRASGDRDGYPRGFAFSSDGMKLFIADQQHDSTAADHINEFQLECPYGLVKCVSDPTTVIGSAVQLSKQNINLNISTIFKRFEWIKRNRDKENLNSFNINLKTLNPVVTSISNKLKDSKFLRQASITSGSNSSSKKSKWSYWSNGDISIGNYENTPIERPKHIKTTGLTFGADKKIDDNKFFGLALRFAQNESNTRGTPHEVDMESLTLNLYGIAPQSEQKYINAVVGLSVLRFDHKHFGKLTGERNGKQIFTAINFRNFDTYKDFNFSPSGRITYGLTHLDDFTNFVSTKNPSIDIIYEEDTFETAEIAVGFLFDLKEYDFTDGTFNTNGGLEAVYDLTPDVKFEHSSQGSSTVNTVEIDNYSEKNVRANLGFEVIYLSGLTFSANYERFQSLDSHRFSHTDSLLIKFGHINEEDSEFAFNFDPLINNLAELTYVKDLNGFDVRLNSSYNFNSPIPEYGANLELSSTF